MPLQLPFAVAQAAAAVAATARAAAGAAGGGAAHAPEPRRASPLPPPSAPPSLQAAKESGESYDPRGTGAAWTHNFLNKKPWHPLTFRNMARVYEKEVVRPRRRMEGLLPGLPSEHFSSVGGVE